MDNRLKNVKRKDCHGEEKEMIWKTEAALPRADRESMTDKKRQEKECQVVKKI